MTTSELRRRACALVLGTIVTALSTSADADSDEQRAVVLFDKGRKLARDGRCAEAVPVLLESLRYAEGVGPLLNLGNCFETLGKIASAHRYFVKAEQVAAARDDTKRREEASQRARSIEKDVSMLIIHVPAWVRTASTAVRVDGELVAKDQWEKPMPIDPGPHEVEVSSPPSPKQAESVTVPGKGARTEWTATTADRSPASISPPSNALHAPVASVEPTKEPRAASPRPPASSSQQSVGLVAGGVGIVGLATSAVFGVLALNAHASVVDQCPTYPTCPASNRAALDTENHDASTYGTISTIGVVVGALLLAGGSVLFFTAPRQHAAN